MRALLFVNYWYLIYHNAYVFYMIQISDFMS
jgi:hypothetical protein